jgi:colanic acid biosynthesis protein WcaH
MTIPSKLYQEILRVLPIFCVDLAITDESGRYFLVKRTNPPLKNEWWVVGGRVLHGETAEQAAIRKLKEEIGVDAEGLEFLGYYEDKFDGNSFEPNAPYHTMSLVFKYQWKNDQVIQLDSQANDWMWAESLPIRFKIKATSS